MTWVGESDNYLGKKQSLLHLKQQSFILTRRSASPVIRASGRGSQILGTISVRQGRVALTTARESS